VSMAYFGLQPLFSLGNLGSLWEIGSILSLNSKVQTPVLIDYCVHTSKQVEWTGFEACFIGGPWNSEQGRNSVRGRSRKAPINVGLLGNGSNESGTDFNRRAPRIVVTKLMTI
jgi:hypothetical protein